ncbi:redoxin domain-containing protein [Ornithinibacillus sp. L9]|uniref:Redoxin domain-containing protein n=1 Tax=Ornithinibacillus caprae TaxID=2678566 RepID=A0A6N8FQC3_9BACI|nr:SCO family protein [Ornithinibacillus caprae]MUK90209.1 redoxin domain-containing protein [Ornithinibacillus caprae]
MRTIKLIIVGSFIFLAACGGYNIDTNMSRDVEPFEFTTQDNETLNLEDLDGQWWIADFIFTNCTTVCLPMTSNMALLQEKIKEEDLDVQLISFSVDPDFDTPEVLKEYAAEYEADLDNWTFLTGYDFQTIKELSIKSFQSALIEPPEDSDQVTHGTSFFLVSPEGEVIKKYNGTTSKETDIIIDDLKRVIK